MYEASTYVDVAAHDGHASVSTICITTTIRRRQDRRADPRDRKLDHVLAYLRRFETGFWLIRWANRVAEGFLSILYETVCEGLRMSGFKSPDAAPTSDMYTGSREITSHPWCHHKKRENVQ